MVMMQPPGSRPGMRSLATTPITAPIRMVQRSAVMGGILLGIIRLRNLNRWEAGSWPFPNVQLYDLGGLDVFAPANEREQSVVWRGVEVQNRQSGSARFIS